MPKWGQSKHLHDCSPSSHAPIRWLGLQRNPTSHAKLGPHPNPHKHTEGLQACANIVVSSRPEDSLAVECLNGASVNQGEFKGVAAKQKEWAEQSETTHSVAHVKSDLHRQGV